MKSIENEDQLRKRINDLYAALLIATLKNNNSKKK